MTLILKKVEAPSREEILEIITNNYALLDTHLELIGKEVGTRERKVWDLVGLDHDKRLVVIGVELRYSDVLFFSVVNRLDWAWEHLAIITRMYPSYQIASDQMPRAIIVAPSYSPSFKKCISYLTYRIKVTLFVYTYLESAAGKAMYLEPVETRVRYEHVLKEPSSTMVPPGDSTLPTKVTTEEIMEFLH